MRHEWMVMTAKQNQLSQWTENCCTDKKSVSELLKYESDGDHLS